MTSKVMARVNKEYYGDVYMMHSRADSIFMTGDTTIEMYEEAFTPAFRKKRLSLGIMNAQDGTGGIYADAFTGNSSTGAGEHIRRKEWALKNNVVIFPCLVGGGSAHGAPADAYHAELRIIGPWNSPSYIRVHLAPSPFKFYGQNRYIVRVEQGRTPCTVAKEKWCKVHGYRWAP